MRYILKKCRAEDVELEDKLRWMQLEHVGDDVTSVRGRCVFAFSFV